MFGIFGFLPEKKLEYKNKSSFLEKISNIKLNYIFVIALSIIIGELGDKTFLASLGLGINYPNYKITLILGSICGMVFSNLLALFFGRFLKSKFNANFVKILSNILFLIFGIIGIIRASFLIFSPKLVDTGLFLCYYINCHLDMGQ